MKSIAALDAAIAALQVDAHKLRFSKAYRLGLASALERLDLLEDARETLKAIRRGLAATDPESDKLPRLADDAHSEAEATGDPDSDADPEPKRMSSGIDSAFSMSGFTIMTALELFCDLG